MLDTETKLNLETVITEVAKHSEGIVPLDVCKAILPRDYDTGRLREVQELIRKAIDMGAVLIGVDLRLYRNPRFTIEKHMSRLKAYRPLVDYLG